MDMPPPADAAPSPMELKRPSCLSSAKSLKHKSKSKRLTPNAGSSGASSNDSGLSADTSAAPAGHHHHHHGSYHASHRHGRSTTSAAANSAAKGEDAMRELLTSKIAELQVGGDENLETPIDLAGTNLAACNARA